MTTPKQIEPSVNNALGDLLRGMMPTCNVRSENTQTFPNYPGRHADVLITATGRSPVVVEAEFEPAPEAEKDARERLGLKVAGEPRSIEAAVALRYPAALETAYVVSSALADANLDYCVLYEDGTRFPESGWLQGNVADLADLIRLVSVPQKEVNPAFAAFEANKADMDAMGSRLNQLGKNTCYHGNAGIASAFSALSDKKLKSGGVLALVLPLSAASGLSWQGLRQLLASDYDDVVVLSIAANG